MASTDEGGFVIVHLTEDQEGMSSLISLSQLYLLTGFSTPVNSHSLSASSIEHTMTTSTLSSSPLRTTPEPPLACKTTVLQPPSSSPSSKGQTIHSVTVSSASSSETPPTHACPSFSDAGTLNDHVVTAPRQSKPAALPAWVIASIPA